MLTVVLGFEDLDPGYEAIGPIPSGYQGFDWSNHAYWITDKYHPGSGYDYGTIGRVSLFTAWASDISQSNSDFDFNGAYITAAWDSTEDVIVQGWDDGILKYSTTITTHNDAAYWFDFDFYDVDTLWFRPQGAQIAIDNITLNANEPPVADADGPYTADEGTPITFDASASSDPDGDPLQYRWDFDDDGTWDTPWSSSPTGSHTYGDDYSGLANVEVWDGQETDIASANVTVHNADPTLSNVTLTPEINEGDIATLAGNISDPGTEDTFTLDVDWGDGTTNTYTYGAGTTSFSESHPYVDDNPSGTPSDVYPVTISFQDDDGGVAHADSSSIDVLMIYDVDNTHTQALKSALEAAGMNVSLSATDERGYTGLNPSPSGFDAVIHLNGTTWTTDMPTAGQNALVNFVDSGGAFLHGEWNAFEFLNGRMQNMRDLTLFDRTGGTWGPFTFSDAVGQSGHPILANVPSSFTVALGVAGNVGTIHAFAANPATVLMVDQLGNDAVAVREYGSGRVVGFHHAGNYSSAATLSDPNIQQLYVDGVIWGAQAGAGLDLSVKVNNVAPTVVLDPVLAIDENGVATLTGSITDPGTLDTFTADINWGDPLSPNNVEQYTYGASGTGSQSFTLTHQYLDDNPTATSFDSYTISATVTDDDTGTGSDTETVTVNNVAPTVVLDPVLPIDENGVATLTGSITDPGTLDTFTLDIDWGDPLSPDNAETYTFGASASGTQTFTLTHPYLDDNPTDTPSDTYKITLTVTDDDGGIGSSSDGSIAGFDSNIILIPPPASLLEGNPETTDESHIFAVVERQNVTLTSDLAVSVVDPAGATFGEGGTNPNTGTLFAGEVVNSHILHYDRPNDIPGGRVTATITFDSPIRALIWDGSKLISSDAVLGNPQTEYLKHVSRRMINSEGIDSITVSADGKTLTTITQRVLPDFIDELRVLTAATGTVETTVTVNNVAPAVDAGADQMVDEGGEIFLSGSFSDPGWLDTHTAEIDWGDGHSEAGVLTESPLRAEAIAVYDFSGNADDVSGNANHATVYGASLTADRFGNANSAYYFDGNDYIQTPVDSNFKPVSFSVWFRADSVAGERSIVDSDSSGLWGHSLIIGYWNGDGTLDAQYHNGHYDTGVGMSTSMWYHAVVNYSDTVEVYLGTPGSPMVKVLDQPYTGTYFDGTEFRFGRHNPGDPQWFLGAIDDAMFFDRVLLADEVDRLHTQTAGVSGSHVYGDNGTYTVTVTVTDDDVGVGTDTFAVTVNNVAPAAGIESLFSRTYTLDADFDEGTLVGVEHDTVHDQLQLSTESTTLPFIWVPNQNGTISKVNTETGDELGRYWVSPHSNSQPSRTTVDLDGSCWVGVRQAGTVVKVGLLEAGMWIDRNANGVPDTSMDLNDDGLITGSEILPWGQDECVLFEVVLISGKEGTYAPGTYTGGYDYAYWGTAPRGLAVDADNNVWAGTWSSQRYYHIDGATGSIIKNVSTPGHGSYGAVIDGNGILWASGWDTRSLLRLDPSDDSIAVQSLAYNSYGLGLDNLDHLWSSSWGVDLLRKVDINDTILPFTITELSTAPVDHWNARGVACTDDGDVWVADTGRDRVYRYDNNGNYKTSIYVGDSPTGVAVDAVGKVWVVNLNGWIHRINPASNTVDLSKNIPDVGGHYGYSDMTGIIARSITTKVGDWTVVYDSEAADTPWGTASWTSDEPGDSSVTVKVASSNDNATWGVFKEVSNGVRFSGVADGRYLKVIVTLQAGSEDESPILYDLTVSPAPVYSGDEGEAIEFSAVATDPGSDDLTFTWDWGDGSSDTVTMYYNNGVSPDPYPSPDVNPINVTDVVTHVYADNGVYTVTLTVEDDDGGVCVSTATVTVDNVAPTVNAGADQTVDESVSGSPTVLTTVWLDPATFNDLGTLDTHTAEIDWGDSTVEPGTVSETPFGPPGSTAGMDGEVSGSHQYADDGTYTVRVTVTDDDGGVGFDEFTVTVENVDPSVEVDVQTQEVQYSDPIQTVTFTAYDIPSDPLSASIAYSVDGGPFLPGLPDAGTVSGELSFDPIAPDPQASPASWTLSGIADLAPGDYTFQVTVTDDDGGSTDIQTEIVVNQEDAIATWVGPTFVSSEPSGKYAFEVELRAVVQDITFFSADPDPGDITRNDIPTGTVTFVIDPEGPGATEYITADVYPIDDDPLTGVAVAVFEGELGSLLSETYEITLDVGAFYTNDEFPEETLVTVSRPTGDFITGGGYLVEEASYGGTATLMKIIENPDESPTVLTDEVELDLADGSKMNFGFNVKWNKQLTNLQGQFTSILRGEDGTRWKVKSTATDTLLVDPETAQATFTAKANLINQATGYSQGGLRMIVEMTDVGEPGSQEVDPDTIGFTLWEDVTQGDGTIVSTLIFSTNWSGSETVEQDLDGGNLQVHLDKLSVAAGQAAVAQAGHALTSAALEPAVQQAIGIWSQSGLDAGQLSLLDRLDVRTADLNGTTLGATFGPTVWIDRDAAAYGWSDSGLDLLSVVTHELGHVLGLEHDDPYDVMAPTLAPGEHLASLPYQIPDRVDNGPVASAVSDRWSLDRFDTRTADEQDSLRARQQLFEALASHYFVAELLERPTEGSEDDLDEFDSIGSLAELLVADLGQDESSEDQSSEEVLEDEVIQQLVDVI